MPGVPTEKCETCGRALLAPAEKRDVAADLRTIAEYWRKNHPGDDCEFWARTLESAAEELER